MGSGFFQDERGCAEVRALISELSRDAGVKAVWVGAGSSVPPRWKRQLLVVEGPLSCRQRRRAVIHLRRVFGRLTFHLNEDNARRAGLVFSEQMQKRASVLVKSGQRRLQFGGTQVVTDRIRKPERAFRQTQV